MQGLEGLGSLRVCSVVALISLCLSWPLGAQDRDETRAQGSAAPVLSNAEEFEAFIDGIMAAHMQSRNIPTAVISVVKDGSLFFAKGYGFADRKRLATVDPETTLFRPGSISKLFTWTAVMQLYERGQLDLDADVNRYLSTFEIPATYPEPITMKHLLTHTPGFEDGGLGYLFIKSEDELLPLNESLRAHVPIRVRSPGSYSSYSNYGTALAGLIVSNISGMIFEDYIESNIFQPLGMENCTFREPLPRRVAANMATGYKRASGVYEEDRFEFISNFGPAGALSCSATDMARFMVMHLQKGEYGGARILQRDTAELMHSQLYTLDPRLPGMAHGFYESRMNGQEMIGHGGDTLLFHSYLVLLPEHDLGLYVSYVANGSWARVELLKALLDRYFPTVDQPVSGESGDFQSRGIRFAGSYRFTRHNSSTIEKLLALAMTFSVSVTEENTLMVSGVFPEPAQFREVEPLLFQQVDGWQTIAFKEGDSGEITHMFFGMLPFMPTYRVAWHATQQFSFLLLGLGALLSITTLVSAFYHRKEDRAAPAVGRWAVRSAVALATLTLIFYVSFLSIVAVNAEELLYGLPASMTAVLFLPIMAAVLSIAAAGFAAAVWKRRLWGILRRLHFSLYCLVALALAWFYWYWNILGFQY